MSEIDERNKTPRVRGNDGGTAPVGNSPGSPGAHDIGEPDPEEGKDFVQDIAARLAIDEEWLSEAATPDPVDERDALVDEPAPVVIDLERLAARGYLVPSETQTVQAQEFRHIKRPLLQNARGRGEPSERLSLIMVTSALPGEGKTFTAINLAMSLATEVDTAVLLVDADVVLPQVLERLGIQGRTGLLDLLRDPDIDLADVVLPTSIPKLSILPAGTRANLATELFASDAMNDFLGSLATKYPDHVVIFDAPPILVTNEAKVLAAQVGQIVLVVEASRTPRVSVEHALAALEDCPIVLTVLNRANEPAGTHGYGYYYG